MLRTASLLTSLGLAWSSGVAWAAQTVGSDLSGIPTGGTIPATFFQFGTPTASAVPVTAGAPGVVVSFKFKNGETGLNPGTVKFAVLSRVGATTFFTGRSGSPALPVPPTATGGTSITEHVPLDAAGRPRGVPIGAGEYVGVALTGTPNSYASAPGGALAISGGDQSGSTANYSTAVNNLEVLVQARVESDADGDGYGDESQDQCPTSAATQGACPVQPPPVAAGVPGAPPAAAAQSPAAGVTNCAATVIVGKDGSAKLCDATNPPTESTTQTLTGTLPGSYAETAKRKARKKPKPGPVATGHTTVPAGQTVPVTVNVTAKAAKALKKRGALKVQASIETRGVDGQTATVSPSVTLKSPKKKRAKSRKKR